MAEVSESCVDSELLVGLRACARAAVRRLVVGFGHRASARPYMNAESGFVVDSEKGVVRGHRAIRQAHDPGQARGPTKISEFTDDFESTANL